MKKQAALLILLCLLLIIPLAGCGGILPATSGPSSPSDPPPPPDSSSEPSATDPPAGASSSPLSGDKTWSSYQWMATGGIAAREGSRIDFTDSGGQITHTFAPDLTTWPDAPEISLWGESFCKYVIGERYILAHFFFYGTPPVCLQDGAPTLTFAAILDHEGNLVKAFRFGFGEDMALLHENERFTESTTRRTEFLWVTEDTLAISTGSHLWLYNVADDELRLKADYTSEVFVGWTKLESHGYGVIEGSLRAQEGALYYAYGQGFTQDASYNGRQQLCRVTWGEEPIVVSGKDFYTSFTYSGGHVFALLLEARIAADGAITPACRFWHIDTQSLALTYIGETTDYTEPIARGRVVAWCDYEPTVLPYLHVQYRLHTFDLDTGERLTFSPTAGNGGFPQNTRLIDIFTLTDVSQNGTDTLLYYTFMNTRDERRAPEDFAYYLGCHNLTTGESVFLDLISDRALPNPFGDRAESILVISPDNTDFDLHPMPAA